ncbi:AlpA family transcriptional regulator [Acinetobacter guillouiae]|uniref:AlpA family transcriptional regulator n=1 Tax=Acinetobacter guillouiae TaxID=106649 RepID=UPI003AF9A575
MKTLKEPSIVSNNIFFIPKFRLTINEVCTMLSVGRDKLNRLEKEDQSFPKSMKDGKNRQSAVYYDYQEISVWYESWKENSRTMQLS